MIVLDQETRLSACLKSTAGLFEEVVVVDTGSRDGTRELARSLGARVFDFDWCDDFSAARNAAQSHCACNYVFWMDADETLPATSRTRVARLLRGMTDDGAMYAMNRRSPRTDRCPGPMVVPSIRLIPNGVGIRWVGRAYERIEAPHGLRTVLLPIEIAHHGFSDPNAIFRELDRNRRLVEIEVEEDPTNPVALHKLAAAHLALAGFLSSRDHGSVARKYLERALEAATDPGSAVCERTPPADTYALLSYTLLSQLAFTDAATACTRGRSAYPGNLALVCAEATVLHQCGMCEEARTRWQLMPRLREYVEGPAVRLGEYARLIAAKTEYAYFLEENGDYYDATAVWAELAKNSAGLFDAVPGLRRSLRLMLRDAVRRPRLFWSNLRRISDAIK